MVKSSVYGATEGERRRLEAVPASRSIVRLLQPPRAPRHAPQKPLFGCILRAVSPYTNLDESPNHPQALLQLGNRDLPQAPKVAGMMALALCAVACVAALSDRMGGQATAMVQTSLHDDGSDFSVADAILNSAGVHDKKGSISASMAALAAQAAQEKETGELVPTVTLPQIPKSIAKMAAEAKHEIMIEEKVDKSRRAVKTAAKLAAAKKLAAKRAQAMQATAKAAAATQAASAAEVKEVQTVQKAAVAAKRVVKKASAVAPKGAAKVRVAARGRIAAPAKVVAAVKAVKK